MATNVTDSFANLFTFGVEDYVVFVLMLGISAAIGVYFGFFSGDNDTADEYLLGGKRMKTWPIAISLVASQLSGISIMTIPAEMYSFGVTFAFSMISVVLVIPVLCYIIIPVFYNNNLSNCYEYLELRFNKATRQVVTAAFILTVYLIMPVFIFIPSLAFSQVTGINIHLINAIVCSICVFYTMLGGIRAVVWTDVIQAAIMLVSVVLVGVMGVIGVGGLGAVIDKAYEGGRLHVNMEFDTRTRATIWNCFIGGFTVWTGYVGFNQSCVQRIVALPSLRHAKKSLVIFGLGIFIIMFFNFFTGFIMYAKYHGCDPLARKLVEKPDKMMPFFVQDIVGHWKGMPGVFISCVFSAALSTMSANLNTLSGVFYFDYVKPYINHTERKASLVMKAFVFFSGFYCILCGLLVENFKSILQVVYTIGGITHGAVFGVFLLGILIPRAHGRPAFMGLVTSMCAMLVIGLISQQRFAAGHVKYVPLPTSVEACGSSNQTFHSSIFTDDFKVTQIKNEDEWSIFDLSFHWYTLTGWSIVWLVAIPLSYIMRTDKKLNPHLLASIAKPFVDYDLVAPDEQTLREVEMKQQLKM